MHRKPVFSLLLSGLCQILGFGAGVFTENYLEISAGPLAAHCVVAWLASCFLKLKLPWQLFNVLIPLAAGALALGEIPNEVFALAALLMVATFLPTLWTKVPYYPTNNKVYDQILAKLPKDETFTFIHWHEIWFGLV